MFLDEIHVTFYADIAAAILTLGVYVLCSRGIIKDDFLNRMFRLLLLTDFFLAVIDADRNRVFPVLHFRHVNVAISYVLCPITAF